MTALRSRTRMCLQGAVMVSLEGMVMCPDAFTPVPGVNLQEGFPASRSVLLHLLYPPLSLRYNQLL